jgi:hypothetical protein
VAVHYFNVLSYGQVTAADALADIAAHPQIFLGDTNHYSQATQAALIDVFAELAARAPHRDLCIEFNAHELEMQKQYARFLEPVLVDTPLKQFDYDMFSEIDLNSLRSIHPNRNKKALLTSLAALYRLQVAAHHDIEVHAVDFDDKRTDAKSVYFRLGRDPEVVANIEAAVDGLPFICIYGTNHLRPNGLLKPYPEQTNVRVFAYGTVQEFATSLRDQTLELKRPRLRLSPPNYIYVGEARAFFRHAAHVPLTTDLS